LFAGIENDRIGKAFKSTAVPASPSPVPLHQTQTVFPAPGGVSGTAPEKCRENLPGEFRPKWYL